MSERLHRKVEQAAQFIRSKYSAEIAVGIVLGSGLGGFAEGLEENVRIKYSQIPHFPISTVEGHAGQLVFGLCNGVGVAALQGRFHYYEGYSLEQVTFPIRVLGVLGTRNLVLTNAAGGINLQFRPGSFMLLSDHINLMGANALRGKHDHRFGPRFPDMTYVYSRRFRDLALREAAKMGLNLEEGVYAAVSGPSYETPAEIQMLAALGADAVGMSTVPEATVARQMGIEVLGISLISNLAAGRLDRQLTHAEVFEMGERVGARLTELLRRAIPELARTSEMRDQTTDPQRDLRGPRSEV